MRVVVLPVLAIGVLAACEEVAGVPASPPPGTGIGAPGPGEVAAAGIPPRQDALTYLCADGTVVRAEYLDSDDVMALGRDAALLSVDGRSVRMLRGASASGVRYIGGGLQWWTRGLDTANLAPLGPNESTATSPGTECRSAG